MYRDVDKVIDIKRCRTIFFATTLIVMLISCDNPSGKGSISRTTKAPLSPPLSSEEQKLCDSLKRFAYESLNNNIYILVHNDTINDDSRHLRFVQVLKEKLHFNYYRTYDINNHETRSFKFCVQPIMDSFIIAKYGIGAKDSIIDIAYSMAQ